MTDAAPIDNGTDHTSRTRRLMGVAHIAGLFGVSPVTVNQWIWRGKHSVMPAFPEPDVMIPTANSNVMIRGWETSREREIREWKARLPGRNWRYGVGRRFAASIDNGTDHTSRTRRLMGVAHIAGLFDVNPVTVNRWIWGAEHGEFPAFPEPDVMIPTANSNVMIRGWETSRECEIWEWKASLPGRNWRKGVTGERRYTTMEHIGKRIGRIHNSEDIMCICGDFFDEHNPKCIVKGCFCSSFVKDLNDE